MEETLKPQSAEVTETSNLETSEVSQIDQLNDLVSQRMGEFEVKINYTDLKHLRNLVHQKLEWKGPNEAYLVIIALLTMDNALSGMDPKSNEPLLLKLPSSLIESVNFFLNKMTGKGIESAQRIFSLAMIFRPAAEELKKLDNKIEILRAKIEETEKNS